MKIKLWEGACPLPHFDRVPAIQSGRLQGRRALAFDLGSPRQTRWPNAGLNPWVTRQDAGLAALGHGWPIAAAHGFTPERGHTEPRRGAECWGKSVLLTLRSSKVSRCKSGTISSRYRSIGYVLSQTTRAICSPILPLNHRSAGSLSCTPLHTIDNSAASIANGGSCARSDVPSVNAHAA